MALANIPRTLKCYRLELEHFGNAGRWSAALRLLSDLKEDGLTPDAKVRGGHRAVSVFVCFSMISFVWEGYFRFFFLERLWVSGAYCELNMG